ncbi:MAG TPA: NAD-binding protein [Pirellulales bacterium]|nr:NAD-binding protein [Pirellulales bacterium]
MSRIKVGVVFFVTTCLIAVVGYMAAGWELLDAIYMVVITVFGVGYGEAKPLTDPALKIFTMGVIVAGCSSGIYVVGGFMQMLAEGEINRILGSRRMSKGIEQLANHAILCGYGRVGQMLARDLAAARFPFVVVDSNESRVTSAQGEGHLALLGSASEESTLETAGIARAKVLAAVLPDDTANVFVTLTARELNPGIQILARAESPSTEKKLIRSGANRVVMPALIGATKIAHMIVRPSAEDMLRADLPSMQINEDLRQIGLELGDIDIRSDSPLVGGRVGDLHTADSSGFVLVGIKRADGSMVRAPQANVELAAGDTLVILGHRETIPKIALRARRTVITYRGVRT